jgi:hypothetical protein
LLPPIIEGLIEEAKDHTVKKIKIDDISRIPRNIQSAISENAG